MSSRIIQSMVLEYKCDECGANHRVESAPESWSNFTFDSWASVGGRVSRRLDLCGDCNRLDKYAWMRA